MEDLVGISEIAKMFDVTPAAVTNWRSRYDDFPKPVIVLKSGPIFRSEQIIKWNRRKNNMATKTIAFINLKGGVAKTTTTVGVGEVLSGEFAKKVLVIDLDPQTNATTMLIGEDKWLELDEQGYTLATLFADAVNDTSEFDLEKTLQKSVGDVKEAGTVDLLPSSLRLIDLQDRLTLMPAGQFGTRNPVSILLRGIKSILNNYDYILIDCPPNLGYITLNGLRIADGYVIPTIPDVLSTYGIPQIVTRISTFSEEINGETGESIVPIGIVATKVRGQASIHTRTLKQMRNRAGKTIKNTKALFPEVFATCFGESAKISEAAEYQHNRLTLRQKWGYSAGQYEAFENFSRELMTACEVL